MTVVAGIDVSPDHFIGGERVASPARFEDISPIDQSRARRGRARRGGGGRPRGPRRARRVPRLGRARAGRPRAVPAPARRPDRRERRAARGGRVRRHGDAAALAARAGDQARRAQLPRLRRPRARLRGARLALERDLEPRPADAVRPRRGDHAVERAVHALDLEDGAGAGGGLHGRAQAGRVVAARRARCSPTSPTRPASRPACSTSSRGSARRPAPRSSPTRCCAACSFTGSPETGRHIAGAAAANLVPFTAELGGKNPFVVFADADLDAAARKAAGQYDDAGQVCLAGTRLLVEESVLDAFLERFHAAVDAHVLGDPRDDATTISPMIHPDHLARVEGFVERARADGQEILRGGRRLDGLFFEPTLIRPTSNDAEIVQREVFGPVLTLADVRDGGGGGRAGQLDRVRALRARLHELAGPGGPGRAGDPRRHRVGQHVPRARPDGAVRRAWASRASVARGATTRSTSIRT